eukprot:Seg2012.8 transcript_id=Seg2012.8/GoldUCD/mRNA.D3Y31 product="Suppressor of fused-like" protein_id=Seg2012.8/GoldUCD/D3Y31
MFANPGNPREGVPAHWHYVSCGLSDLHGDGRVHDVTGDDGPSGFGFELSFRLKRDAADSAPPTWPAELMQNLARYVFHSENNLCSGDHVSWHNALDGNNRFIQQMLMADDPHIPQINTPFGYVNFVQAVGVCNQELQAAQHWNGPAVLDLMRLMPETGGAWLVTDMDRSKSIFEVNPTLQQTVEDGITRDGSNLSGVSAKCWWASCSPETIYKAGHRIENGTFVESESRPTSTTKTTRITEPSFGREDSELGDGPDSRLSNYSTVSELVRAKSLDAVQLRFNLEAASLLPLVFRGRLAHGRHFTFKSIITDSAITLVSSDVTGTSVDEKCPYASCGTWLQVLIPDDFMDLLIRDLDDLSRPEEVRLPKQFVWPGRNMMITVVEDAE